jgi:antirestriction protein ArdC
MFWSPRPRARQQHHRSRDDAAAKLFILSRAGYSAIRLHELTQSTGHSTRLARESITEAAAFGSAVYSKAELIAEMGGAYLCAEAEISSSVIQNQASYDAGWLRKLREDRRFVIHAAAQAQHAADCILGRNTTDGVFRGARALRERRSH